MNNETDNLQEVWKNEFCSLQIDIKNQVAVCSAISEYIPIESFKTIFLRISDQVETSPLKYLIFDKRNLRTFDQPSMEWYFTVWKPSVKKTGLANHFKILPELLWFQKAVEAGKDDIYKRFPANLFNGINIYYVKNLEEAFKIIKDKPLLNK